MTKTTFSLMTSALIILSACSQFSAGSQPSGEVVTYYPKYEQKEIILFDLGRSLSHNAVDIYDPASTSLTIPPDEPKYANPLSRFPAHPHLLIRDEDVVVYSLFSNDALTGDEMLQPPDEILAPPVPLNDGEGQLPP